MENVSFNQTNGLVFLLMLVSSESSATVLRTLDVSSPIPSDGMKLKENDMRWLVSRVWLNPLSHFFDLHQRAYHLLLFDVRMNPVPSERRRSVEAQPEPIPVILYANEYLRNLKRGTSSERL